MKPKVVSYYSKKLFSDKVYSDFVESCKEFDIAHEIEELDTDVINQFLAYKPKFIIQCLEKFDEPVVYVDIDSVFMGPIDFFDTLRADISLRLRDDLPFEDDYKLLANTLYLKPTYSGKKLLNLWNLEAKRRLKKETEVNPLFDQLSLKKVILHYPTIVEMKRIPARYFSFPDMKNPEAKIIHHNLIRENYLQLV